MKKKHIAWLSLAALMVIFCLWYTKGGTVEDFCPAVELGECTEIRLRGYMEGEYPSENDDLILSLTPEDEQFGEIIEMLETRRFRRSFANLWPLGTKAHATGEGDFWWRMHFRFEDVDMPFGTVDGVLFSINNLYGDLELNYTGEKSRTWRVTTDSKDGWLTEIYDIIAAGQ